MEIQDYMGSIRARYKNMVKPILGSGNNVAIQGELLDIVTLIERRRIEIMEKIHCGIGVIGCARLLERDILKEKTPSKNQIRNFEAYLAQTGLPLGKTLE